MPLIETNVSPFRGSEILKAVTASAGGGNGCRTTIDAGVGGSSSVRSPGEVNN